MENMMIGVLIIDGWAISFTFGTVSEHGRMDTLTMLFLL